MTGMDRTPKMLRAWRLVAAGVLSLLALGAAAQTTGGMDSLEYFVRNTRSGRADFTQVVTAPAREGQAAKSKTSSGTFEFSRPNRFKFFYHKPFEQTIVADGQTLWLHDVDLNQVTARKLSQVMGGTPAALIAAAPELLEACSWAFNLFPNTVKNQMIRTKLREAIAKTEGK